MPKGYKNPLSPHTPAPWFIREHNGEFFITSEEFRKGQSMGIAEVYKNRANAQLIATAPDLLHAANKAANNLQSVINGFDVIGETITEERKEELLRETYDLCQHAYLKATNEICKEL